MARSRSSHLRLTVLPIFFNLMILIGAAFSAIQMRFLVPIGQNINSENYAPHNYIHWLISIAGGMCLAYILAVVLHYGFGIQWLTPWRQLRVLLASIGFISILALVSLESGALEVVYFVSLALTFGSSVITIPSSLRATAYKRTTVDEDILRLLEQRFSIMVWLQYRMAARYSQQVLGLAWVILEPLMLAVVMTIAFTRFLGLRSTEVPYISFLLSGLVIFNFFRQCVSRSTRALVFESSLIKQVYFPREILILLIVGEEAIDAAFAFLVLVVINLLLGITPSIYFLLFPIPVFFLLCFTTGLTLVLGWLGLIIRDLEQLANIALRLLFYVTVLYSGQDLGGYAFLVYLNPLIGILEVFRDCVLYTRMPDFSDLFLSGSISLLLLYIGYVVYKVKEDRFADFV